MTSGSEAGDARNSAVQGQSERPTRRRVLTSIGGGAAALLAGCAGSGRSSNYVDGEANASELDVSNNSSRSTSEMSTAASLAQTEPTDSASSLGSLELADHEFAFEGGYKGSVVRGTVTNTSEETISLAEVRVRVFDDGGTYLGQYMDSIGDLAAGTTWQFEVILLVSPADIATYDIAVFGVPE